MTEPMQPPAAPPSPWLQPAPPPPPPPAPPQTVPVPTTPPPAYPPAAQHPPFPLATSSIAPHNGLAIASMVVGIAGILFFWLYAIPCIVAVVLGHVGLSQLERKHQAGKGMAVAGIATGYSGIGLFLLVIVIAAANS